MEFGRDGGGGGVGVAKRPFAACLVYTTCYPITRPRLVGCH